MWYSEIWGNTVWRCFWDGINIQIPSQSETAYTVSCEQNSSNQVNAGNGAPSSHPSACRLRPKYLLFLGLESVHPQEGKNNCSPWVSSQLAGSPCRLGNNYTDQLLITPLFPYWVYFSLRRGLCRCWYLDKTCQYNKYWKIREMVLDWLICVC